jgi:protein-tyrosine phosphatase
MIQTNAVSREVTVKTGFNLRDFGGHTTHDGRKVRRGVLYRSGTMAMLDEEDAAFLRSLEINAICDFRRGDERASEPTLWHVGSKTHYWSHDYEQSTGMLTATLRSHNASANQLRDVMIQLYRDIPVDHAPAYRAMFVHLGEGATPILINCSAGKDRTGVAAALVLASLGVPRASIIDDYLLTNELAEWDRMMAHNSHNSALFNRVPPETLAPVLAADAEYLETMFQTLDERFGGLDGYLERELGVDTAARHRMHETLLEG